MMDREFTFSDLGRVHWGTTIKLSLARGFAAGILWALVTSFGPAAAPVAASLLWPFVWAVIALPFAMSIQLVGMAFGMIIPLLGLFFHFIGSLMMCLGDPLVYLVNRTYPRFLNIADLNFINFRPVIFITHPD